jgi:hypothetical protein
MSIIPTRLVERIQRLVPAPDGGDDLMGVLGSSEGARVGAGLCGEAVYGGLERDDGVAHAAPEPPVGGLGEEATDGVQP